MSFPPNYFPILVPFLQLAFDIFWAGPRRERDLPRREWKREKERPLVCGLGPPPLLPIFTPGWVGMHPIKNGGE